jgi:DNA-binding GntR family transcriptional regulator
MDRMIDEGMSERAADEPQKRDDEGAGDPDVAIDAPEHATLGARIHAQLRDLLISGQLQPGDKVSLRTLSQRLGVSMQPVREAVSRLIADEALEVLPNRAVRVPLMTAARFDDLTRVRLAIEGFAVEAAAAARREADLVEIRRQDKLFRRASRSPDVASDAAVLANRDLHFAIYRAAHLSSLIPIIEGLWLRIGPVLNLDMRADPERLKSGNAERCHARLVAAIEARDAIAARAALTDDIMGAADVIRSHHVVSME